MSILIFLTMTLASSCQDKQNIKITGRIIDNLTGEPISSADVVVLCWYQHNVDDESFQKETFTTDKSGSFTVKFDKGHKVDIASQAEGFLPAKKNSNLESNEINVEIKLRRDKENATLVSYLTTEVDFVTISDQTPFLRLRTQNNKTESYGFDFATLTTKVDTSNCDLWFKIEKTPRTLVAQKSGGIIPIFKNEVKSSLLYEFVQAPTSGYRKSYTLTGDEEGFFVKCRDGKTFAKVILVKGTAEITAKEGFKDQGKYFSYFYQQNGSTDLTYPKTKIDLERFLIDFNYK